MLFCPASLPPFPFRASRAHTRVSVAGDDVTKVLLRLQGHMEYTDA